MLTVAVILMVTCVLADSQYYVSTKGSDSTGDGSQAKPWATVFKARDAIRQSKLKTGGLLSGPTQVNLDAGTYYMNQTFELTMEDSGTPSSPITYAGSGNGFSVLSAGIEVAIPSGRFLSRPSALAPNGVVQIPLASYVGCDIVLRQAWGLDGARRSLTTTGTLEYASFNGSVINPKPNTLPNWTNATQALASADAIIFHSWTAALAPVAGMTPSGSIRLQHKDTDTGFSAALSRYRLQNIVDPATMQPGEFAHDHEACSLVYAPLQGEASVVIPKFRVAASISSNASQTGTGPPPRISNVHFRNLNFTHSKSTVARCRSISTCDGQSFASEQHSAVMVSMASNVSFEQVAVAHTGDYAMVVGQGSDGVTISRSHFFDLGVGGVRIGEPNHGAAPAGSEGLVATGVTLQDSIIEDGGHVILEGCGVLLEQAHDNLVTHNTIRNMLYSGVSVGWDWTYEATSNRNNVVSYNDISEIMQGELSDGGCVYHLGRSPGTVIDHNVCNGVNSAGYGGWGLYTDQGSSNVTITNNIVHSTKSASFHQHFGTDNLIANNVFAFPDRWACAGAGGCDNAAVRSSQHAPGSGLGEHSSFTFERNIVLLFNSTASLFDSTNSIGFNNMTMDYNVYWSLAKEGDALRFPPTQSPRTFAQWQAAGKDVHSQVADPKFVDPMGLDFQHLDAGSPALALGFKPIDASSVGPRPGGNAAALWPM